MNTQHKFGRASLMALVALGLCAALVTGCSKQQQEPEPNRDPDRYGYIKTRDTDENPSDNAAIRHERRGHNRWRP